MADVAVLGAGYWGQKHIRTLLEVRGFDRVHCFDPRAEIREALARRFAGVKVHERPDDLLADPGIRAAVIATPPRSHYALARQWIRGGKHVLVEKPVVLRAKEAEELALLAARRSVALLPGHTLHFHGAVEYLKDFIARGELGDPLWLASERLGPGRFWPDVGVLWDLGPHEATVLFDLLDPKIETCHAVESREPAGGGTSCCVAMAAAGGTGMFWHLSWHSPVKVRRTTLVGSRSMVLWDDLDPLWPLRVYRGELVAAGRLRGATGPALDLAGAVLPALSLGEPLRKECQHFADVVNGLVPPALDTRHLVKVTALLERAAASVT